MMILIELLGVVIMFVLLMFLLLILMGMGFMGGLLVLVDLVMSLLMSDWSVLVFLNWMLIVRLSVLVVVIGFCVVFMVVLMLSL